MTISANNQDQAIAEFQSLPAEEQLAALGTLFKEVSTSVPTTMLEADSEVTALIEQIQGMRQDEQVQTLNDFLASKGTKFEGVALDPHPSKALLELVPGSTQPALSRYESLGATSRLALWFHLGQQFSSSIPADALSPKATELLTALRSLSAEEQGNFLSQLV